MLRDAPELEARTLFEYFLARPDSGLEERHLRTFFRRVRQWRATHGPEREGFFAQERQPGELLQLDWTYAKALGVTIQGEVLDHRFCHCVLPYSNWEWATRCLAESFLSLVAGLQAALAQLGKCPPHLGPDNSSAATHELEALPGRPRGYNSDYLELCTHYDLTPLTINVGCPHEQGDVESGNRHLKRRLGPHLLLRGSREFNAVAEDDRFVAGVLRAANAPRQARLAAALAGMRPLPAGRLAEYREYAPVVSSQSLIRVKGHAYSVPSRLIGHTLRVELSEAVLKLYLGREFVLERPRLRGARQAHVDLHLPAVVLQPVGVMQTPSLQTNTNTDLNTPNAGAPNTGEALGDYPQRFKAHLEGQGYTRRTVAEYVRCIETLGRLMRQRGVGLDDLDGDGRRHRDALCPQEANKKPDHVLGARVPT